MAADTVANLLLLIQRTQLINTERIVSWFHVLCKNISIEKTAAGETRIAASPQGLSHADTTWIRAGFLLTWGPGSSNEICTTLVCFGAHRDLEKRFEHLGSHPSWMDAVKSPFNLFLILLEELFLVFDSKVWDLSDVFRTMELDILQKAQKLDPAGQFDFVGLHNVSKHIAYLNEAADAFLLIVEGMRVQSKALPCAPDVENIEEIVAALAYQKNLFHSGSLRLKSLDKRMQNITNLSFNLVTQHDSKVMQRDSDSMKTIAAVTLFFLPITTVATIFGTQFFNFDPKTLQISDQFWILWVVSLLVTAFVLGSWHFYQQWTTRHMNIGHLCYPW